jgi:hypothetical protein
MTKPRKTATTKINGNSKYYFYTLFYHRKRKNYMTDKILIKIDNLEVQIPASHIIVEKDEYLKLKNKASQGQYMTLSEVLEMVSVSRPWFLEHVLYRADIRSKIDIEKNKDGFVKYPQNQGGKYIFLASKTRAFFEQHFSELLKET